MMIFKLYALSTIVVYKIADCIIDFFLSTRRRSNELVEKGNV